MDGTSKRTERGILERRESITDRMLSSGLNLQRRLSQVAHDCTAEDVSSLIDPSSLIAKSLAESQERDDEQLMEGKRKEDKKADTSADGRHVRRDELAFVFGVLNVVIVAFWIGRKPETYYVYWTFKSIVLFSWRYLTYRKKQLHWLMLELCYFGNFLGLAHVWYFPQSQILRKLSFAFASGPLMWSIMAMRNSLVFHDVDKSTTLMMHASPAIAVWTLRWHDQDHAYMALLGLREGLRDLFMIPVVLYMIWVVLYYLICFKWMHERIKSEGGVTMFDLMVPKDPKKINKSPILKYITSFSEEWQPIVYLAFHGFMASLSFLPTFLFWNSYWSHTGALAFCLLLSVWNGGTFYFKVFARKYYNLKPE